MRVVRGVWRVLVGVKDALVLLVLLIFFGLLFAALAARPNPRIAGSGALVLDLEAASSSSRGRPTRSRSSRTASATAANIGYAT